MLSLIMLTAAAAAGVIALAGDGELDGGLLVVALAFAALAGLAAWSVEHSATRRRAALGEKRRGAMADRAREHEATAERDLAHLRGEAEETHARLMREREARLRTERARRAEREWGRELRQQVAAMHRGQSRGPRELVLETAIELSGARRGLLLAQEDRDGDARLDLVCHRGFEGDPGASSLAQRFAGLVMERDQIIREDSPGDGHAPADEEIDNLVAIPVYMSDHFDGVIVCANRPGGFEELDDDVLLALGDHAGAVLENQELHDELRFSYLAVVRMLADAIEAKDPFVRPDSEEVAHCIQAVARSVGLDESARERLVLALPLRDVGKLGISDVVLLKPGPLSADERRIVEQHALIGSRMVERLPALAELAPSIRHHHERWDGDGYPARLSGEEIPLEARLIAVADAYSALTSTRPYRRPVSRELACEEIERCAGTQFDPEIAALFVAELRALGTAVPVPRTRDEPVLGHALISSTDQITLLSSHRRLQEAADDEAVLARRLQRPFAVVMLELSTLSQINRNEGYAAGDEALRDLGEAVGRALDGRPAVAGRFSGRRLAIVLSDTGHHEAKAIAARVLGGFDGARPPLRTSVSVWRSEPHRTHVRFIKTNRHSVVCGN